MDWGIVTALSGVAAVLVALWAASLSLRMQKRLAYDSLREQGRLAERSLDEQARLAHNQFLRDLRAPLYADVLLFLRARSGTVDEQRARIQAHEQQANRSDLQRLFAETLAEIRALRGVPPPIGDAGASGDVPHLKTHEILSAFTEALELPADLRVRMDLLGSLRAQNAVTTYTGMVAFPELANKGDVDAWIKALELSISAMDDLTKELMDDLRPEDADAPRI